MLSQPSLSDCKNVEYFHFTLICFLGVQLHLNYNVIIVSCGQTKFEKEKKNLQGHQIFQTFINWILRTIKLVERRSKARKITWPSWKMKVIEGLPYLITSFCLISIDLHNFFVKLIKRVSVSRKKQKNLISNYSVTLKSWKYLVKSTSIYYLVDFTEFLLKNALIRRR